MQYFKCKVVLKACMLVYAFDDHRSCAIAGYEFSGASLEALDPERVNREELAVKFECKKIINKPIIPPLKPGIPS
jgi:hypothetical protein